MRDLDQATYWILAICYQGERLTRTHAWRRKSSPPKPLYANTTLRAEAQFFLNAIRKADRYLIKIKKHRHIIALTRPAMPLIDKFGRLTKRGKKGLIPDKREHDDDYLGTNQKKPEMSAVPSQSGLKMKVSPSVTVLKDERILLGGDIDVQSTIGCASKLAAILRERQHKFWDRNNKSIGANPYGRSKYLDRLVSP